MEANNNCIGNLEHHIHRVFASVRVAGEDFVYSHTTELFSRLDDYCDESTMAESKLPLLIRGESGTGKTALLANWLHRREHSYSKLRNNSDEFFFWHAVGCSRQSLNVNSMLRRLISDLKNKFELSRQIPKSQERLSWELARFLELAAKKGRVILVIDGLHRLRSNDGSEDALAWLPLSYPPNVRVILSVTTPSTFHETKDANEPQIQNITPFMTPAFPPHSSREPDMSVRAVEEAPRKKNRILSELDRRALPSITMKALDGLTCRSLINAYVEKSIIQESSKMAAGPFVNLLLKEQPVMTPKENNAHAVAGLDQPKVKEFVCGFLLFESQIDTLLGHQLGGNPLFLRLFLRCLHFLCLRGYSLWRVFEEWIAATSVQDLISRILRTCESGFSKTRIEAQRDCDLSLAAGGLPEIKRIYPWHPAFKGEDLKTFSEVIPLNPYAKQFGHGDANDDKDLSIASGQENQSVDKPAFGDDLGRKETTALSNQVIQNLGDQQWVIVEKQVQRQLQRALIDSRRVVEDVMAANDMGRSQASFVNEVLAKMKRNQADDNNSVASVPVVYSRALNNNRASIVSSPCASVENESTSPSRKEASYLAASDDDESWEDKSLNLPKISNDSNEGKAPFNKEFSEPPTPLKSTNQVQHALVHGQSTQFFSPADFPDTRQSTILEVDPSENFMQLPLYLRGGESVSGFGDLIGNALSLLYVARQGLREGELWKILSNLQMKKRLETNDFQERREMLVAQEQNVHKIASNIINHQSLLADIFMAEDITKQNYIPISKMRNCLAKCMEGVTNQDVQQLLEFLNKHAFGGSQQGGSLTGFSGQPFINDNYFHYAQLLAIIKKLDRKFHFGDQQSSSKPIASSSFGKTAETSKRAGTADIIDDDTFDDFHLNADFQDGGGLGGQMESSNEDNLGPVVEEFLLNVLCALGVLYSPENKVLILPSDSEPFRKTIYDRYILPRGGGSIQYWHNLIIQYFRTQENSLRKCEEMPWHLKICRKWTTLKDCLVDLKTFDLMFNNDLKDELMDYWKLLTEGPLFVVDPVTLQNHIFRSASNTLASSSPLVRNHRTSFLVTLLSRQGGNGDDDDGDNQSTLSHILKEIDAAQSQRLSLREIKRKIMKYQIQPFDVVEELNRSLEAWVTAERPSPMWIHKTIMQIARFLLEFSKTTHTCPHFRRLGIDMAVLERFGILFDDLKEMLQNNGNSPQPVADVGDDMNALSEAKTLAESPSKAAGQSKDKDKYFDGLQKQDILRFPTPKMVAGNLYLYLRWIWIQFPWLALHPAATVIFADKNDDLNTTNDFGDGEEEENEGMVVDDSVKHLMRVWNIKKSDPTVPVFTSSLNRKLAAIKPRTSLSSNLERNVEASCRRLYEELAAPSHIVQARLGIGITQRDKFRRSFQQEVELSKSMPFAYHGKKALKSGSLFPSYNAFVREANKKKVEADLLYRDNSDTDSLSLRETGKKKRPLKKFNVDKALKNMANGGDGTSTFFLTELDDEIRRISHEEYMESHRSEAVGVGGLIKDETDLELVALLDRISQMKSINNKLLIIQREKERSIDELENEIILRQESDTFLINEVQNGESLLKSLHERNVTMEKSFKEAKILQDGYLELLKALKLNPPYSEAHVRSLEIEVELANQQFNDLSQHRQRLYNEGEKLDTVRKQQLSERISYFRVARDEVNMKKKQIVKEIKHLKGILGDKKRENSSRRRQRSRRGDRESSRRNERMNTDRSFSSDDSDSSKESLKDLTLTKPVIHFLNALVRKVTYNEPIIKETDKSLDDVKKRAAETTRPIGFAQVQSSDSPPVETVVPPVPAPLSVASGNTSLTKRKSRLTEVLNRAHLPLKASVPPHQHKAHESDNESAGGSLQSLSAAVNRGIAANNAFLSRRRLSQDELVQLKDSIKSLVHPGRDQMTGGAKDNFKIQLQKALALMLQKTESNSFDEFLERFLQGQSLLETLRSQQVLVDSRLSQLRAEHAELYTVWSDISFLADESTMSSGAGAGASAVATSTTPSANDANDRYLDNQLFAKEVRLHRFQRMYDKSVHVVSEVRTAISHIMSLLVVNSKLLAALPRIPPPSLQTDQDLVTCLSWCEERIIALNEALTMDANRPNAATNEEKSKPLAQRQADLAEEIHNLMHERKGLKTQYKSQRKSNGAMSKVLIASSDSNGFVSSPRNVVVPPVGKLDKIYDAKMTKLLNERDRQLDLNESHNYYSWDNSAQNEVQRFLLEGLDMKKTKDMSRHAKTLVNKRSGRAQTYGLVLEELMKARGQALNLHPSSPIKETETTSSENDRLGEMAT